MRTALRHRRSTGWGCCRIALAMALASLALPSRAATPEPTEHNRPCLEIRSFEDTSKEAARACGAIVRSMNRAVARSNGSLCAAAHEPLDYFANRLLQLPDLSFRDSPLITMPEWTVVEDPDPELRKAVFLNWIRQGEGSHERFWKQYGAAFEEALRRRTHWIEWAEIGRDIAGAYRLTVFRVGGQFPSRELGTFQRPVLVRTDPPTYLKASELQGLFFQGPIVIVENRLFLVPHLEGANQFLVTRLRIEASDSYPIQSVCVLSRRGSS